MPTLDDIVPFAVLALLFAAAVRLRARLREPLAQGLLDDEAIRSIERAGRVEIDDELDPAIIEEEERRFLEDSPWEEPEGE